MATYTGVVTPLGVADVRELEHLTITKYAVDPKMANNCYLLTSKPDGSNLLIDAADGAESLIQLCDGAVDTIVTTHQHWDHHRALAEMVEMTRATTVAGAPDADAITEQTGVTIDRRVGDGDTVTVGKCSLEVIRLTGHTPGAIALLYDDPDGLAHLFTGDSLFPGGPGRTTSPEAFTSLMDDLEAKVFERLPDDTWFYPGHGDDSTIGAERPNLAEWRERGW